MNMRNGLYRKPVSECSPSALERYLSRGIELKKESRWGEDKVRDLEGRTFSKIVSRPTGPLRHISGIHSFFLY